MVAVEDNEGDDARKSGEHGNAAGEGSGSGNGNGNGAAAKRVRPRFEAMPSFAEEQQPTSPIPIDTETARSPVATTSTSYLQTRVL
jgi:hypothetical protein